MKKQLLLMVTIAMCMCNNSKVNSDDTLNTYLIINDKARLFETNSNAKQVVIRDLKRFEKIILLDTKIENDKMKIQTSDGKIGWVEENLTSYIPKTWIKVDDFDEVLFYIPKGMNYKIFKRGWRDNNVFISKQESLESESYFFSNIRFKQNYSDFVDKKKDDYFQHRCKDYGIIRYKADEFFVYSCVDEEFLGNENYSLVINLGNDTLEVGISPNVDITEKILNTMLKILFSVEIKK